MAFVLPDDAKLRSLAEFAAGAGHEINNPVATIVGHVQRLLRDEPDLDRRQTLLTIGAQAYRIRDMIADVMLFARPPDPVLTPVDLGDLAREVVDRLASEYPGHAFDLQARETSVSADRTQLAVVLSELLRNSVQASPPPSTIRVVVEATENGGATWGQLRVSDSGTGLSELDREHLFDPFYSGRQAGRGLGFGLSKCWRIVAGHGGRIFAETENGTTTFTVLIPGGNPQA